MPGKPIAWLLILLIGLARRVIKNFGRVRPLMAAGCPERFPDREFLSYIWHFEKLSAPQFIHEIDLHGATVPVCILESHSQCRELIQ
ncbi:hypothetical protein AB833_31660 [Chromatiales bacterium (ex Bugula neritina AB1)]|nr:hypothetical protein AB833_31660 [Chromatiales bacterium (ex Bugula neritina AB1)]